MESPTCHYPTLSSVTEYNLQETNQCGRDRSHQREKTVRGLGLDDRNLFLTEICMSCKCKEALDLKIAQDIIRILMMNMLWGLFKPITTVFISVTVFQMIGKSNGLLSKRNKSFSELTKHRKRPLQSA